MKVSAWGGGMQRNGRIPSLAIAAQVDFFRKLPTLFPTPPTNRRKPTCRQDFGGFSRQFYDESPNNIGNWR